MFLECSALKTESPFRVSGGRFSVALCCVLPVTVSREEIGIETRFVIRRDDPGNTEHEWPFGVTVADGIRVFYHPEALCTDC